MFTPFLLGVLIAYMLQPGVEWLVRHHMPRGLAALLMMLLFALLVTLLCCSCSPQSRGKGPSLRSACPTSWRSWSAWLHPKLNFLGLGKSLDLGNVREMLAGQREGIGYTVTLAAWRYLRTSGNAMVTVLSMGVLVPLVLFYLLYDRHEALARMESFVPRRWVGKTRQLVREMDRMLSQYLRGQLLVMGVLAVYYPIALTIAGFEIALPVGVFTGLAVFIPYVGFATGLALALLAALLQFGRELERQRGPRPSLGLPVHRYRVWQACRRRELYKENWIDWHELEKASKIEAFGFLDAQLKRATLTISAPGGVDFWPDHLPPSHPALCLLQRRDPAEMHLLNAPREGLDLLATPERTARPSWITTVPEPPAQPLAGVAAPPPAAPVPKLPFWMECAI